MDVVFVAVAVSIREADAAAREALLKVIAEKAPSATINQISDLAQAYSAVVTAPAPQASTARPSLADH